MLKTERQARILNLLAARRFASTDALASELGVSPETIRRDINSLDLHRELRRIRGGAAAVSSAAVEPHFDDRRVMNQDAKEKIGRLAARLLHAGQTVFIDLGSTAVQVARAVAAEFRGIVATTSLLVAAELAGRPGIDVLVCGGKVRGGDLACSNAQAAAFFAGLNADVAFLGSGGVDVARGLTDYHLDEVATRRQMISNARQSYVLADSAKFGVVAPHFVCQLWDVDGLICDSPPGFADAFEREGGQIICD